MTLSISESVSVIANMAPVIPKKARLCMTRRTLRRSNPFPISSSKSRPAMGAITSDMAIGASARKPASCRSAPNSRLIKVGNQDNTRYNDQLIQIWAAAIAHTALDRSIRLNVRRGYAGSGAISAARSSSNDCAANASARAQSGAAAGRDRATGAHTANQIKPKMPYK